MNPDVIKIRRSEKAKITIFIFYTLVFVFIFSSLFDEMGIRRSIYFNSLGYGVYVILALGLILCIYFIYINIYNDQSIYIFKDRVSVGSLSIKKCDISHIGFYPSLFGDILIIKTIARDYKFYSIFYEKELANFLKYY